MAIGKVLVGIILIIIGVSLVLPGIFIITGEPSGNTVNEYSSHVYTSPVFNFSRNKVLIMISSDNTSAGLVSCSRFTDKAAQLNKTNIGNYTVKPTKYIDGEPLYANLNGSYKYVVITDKSPALNYNFISQSELKNVTYASYIAATGALLTGSGIILAMVTVLFRKINARK
jgi:hypothetical protein